MSEGKKAYSKVLVTISLLFFIFLFTGSVSTTQSDSFPEYAYVPNAKDNTVTVINTTTNTVVDTLPVGNGPNGVAVNYDGSKVYVTDSGDDNNHGYNFSIINMDNYEVTSKLVDAGNGIKPYGIAITPDETLYIASHTAGNVYAINLIADTTKMIHVGTNPIEVAITPPDGKWVYVANRGSDDVSVIDTSTNTVIATVPVGRLPYGVAASPDGSKVYVTNSRSNNVSVIETATNKVIDTVPVGINPTGVAVTPNGKTVYVANHNSYKGTVSVINTTTNKVTDVDIHYQNPCGVAVTSDGTKVYVTASGSGKNYPGRVFVISTINNSVIKSIEVGVWPTGLGQFIGHAPRFRVETKTTLSSSQNFIEFFGSIPAIATVSRASHGTEKPSGKVIFMDGYTPIGSASDINSAGQARLDTSSLSSGPHYIRAVYMGDAKLRPSVSNPLIVYNKNLLIEFINGNVSIFTAFCSIIAALIGLYAAYIKLKK